MSTATTHVHTATLISYAGEFALNVTGGTVTHDDAWAPYIQASIDIGVPSLTVLARLDPREAPRIRLVTTSNNLSTGTVLSTKTYSLGLRSKEMDHATRTITIRAESDEARLQDYRLFQTTPNNTLYSYQTSLRTMVNTILNLVTSSTLSATDGGGDVGMNIRPTVRNLFSNPSLETNTTGWAGTNVTAALDATWSSNGTKSLKLTATGTADGWANLDGDLGDIRNGMAAGRTYTVSGDIRLSAAQTGTIDARARRIVVFYRRQGFSNYSNVQSTQAANVAGVTRLAVTFTLPEDATDAAVRFYHGSSAGTVWWDSVRLSEGDGTTIKDTAYFDGSTPTFETSGLEYAWDGTPGQSPSTRTATHGRDVDLLSWKPGQSTWDLLQGLVEAQGFRLYCDHARVWRMVPTDYAATSTVFKVGIAENATAMTESVSRDDDNYYTRVLVKYSWTDARGIQREAFDMASTGGSDSDSRTLYIEKNAAFSGIGLAQVYLKRAKGAAPLFDVECVSDYSVVPTQPIDIRNNMDGAAARPARVISAVTFNLSTGSMRIETRAPYPA